MMKRDDKPGFKHGLKKRSRVPEIYVALVVKEYTHICWFTVDHSCQMTASFTNFHSQEWQLGAFCQFLSEAYRRMAII